MVNESFIASLGWTQEEGKRALAEYAERGAGKKDTRICVCGHLAGAHSEFSKDEGRKALIGAGIKDCRPSRMVCPCSGFVPVLTASEPRKFVRKTVGTGALHALGLGIQSALDAEIEIEWIDSVGTTCQGCHTENVRVTPVALTAEYQISNDPQPINMLLCGVCLTKASA